MDTNRSSHIEMLVFEERRRESVNDRYKYVLFTSIDEDLLSIM